MMKMDTLVMVKMRVMARMLVMMRVSVILMQEMQKAHVTKERGSNTDTNEDTREDTSDCYLSKQCRYLPFIVFSPSILFSSSILSAFLVPAIISSCFISSSGRKPRLSALSPRNTEAKAKPVQMEI